MEKELRVVVSDSDLTQIYMDPSEELLRSFFKRLPNTNVSFIYEPPEKVWSTRLPNGTWTGIIASLIRNEVDISTDEFIVTPAKHKVVAFTPYIRQIHCAILSVKKSESIENLLYSIKGFGPIVLILFTLSLLATAAICTIFSYLKASSQSSCSLLHSRQTISFFLSIYAAYLFRFFGASLGQSMEKTTIHIKLHKFRIIVSAFLIHALVLSICFATFTKSNIVVNTKRNINSLRELLNDPDMCPVTLTTTAIYTMIQRSDDDTYQKLWRRMQSCKLSHPLLTEEDFLNETLANLIEEKRLAIIYFEHALLPIAKKLCEIYPGTTFHISREKFYSAPYSLPMRKTMSHEFQIRLKNHILSIRESGIYLHWYAKATWKEMPGCLTNWSIPDVPKMRFQTVVELLQFLLVGMFISGVVVLLEIMFNRYCRI